MKKITTTKMINESKKAVNSERKGLNATISALSLLADNGNKNAQQVIQLLSDGKEYLTKRDVLKSIKNWYPYQTSEGTFQKASTYYDEKGNKVAVFFPVDDYNYIVHSAAKNAAKKGNVNIVEAATKAYKVVNNLCRQAEITEVFRKNKEGLLEYAFSVE